jgi:hypothetical protein
MHICRAHLIIELWDLSCWSMIDVLKQSMFDVLKQVKFLAALTWDYKLDWFSRAITVRPFGPWNGLAPCLSAFSVTTTSTTGSLLPSVLTAACIAYLAERNMKSIPRAPKKNYTYSSQMARSTGLADPNAVRLSVRLHRLQAVKTMPSNFSPSH